MTDDQYIFDRAAENYDEGHVKAVALSGFKPSYFHEYKVKETAQFLQASGDFNREFTLLNYGCGVGGSERYLRQYLPQSLLYGTDISTESIRVARESHSDMPNVTFEPLRDGGIPFDIEFDVIFVAMVFHHIRYELQLEVLKNLKSHLKSDGRLFIFELNPFNPLTMYVAITNDYRFDKDAKLLTVFRTKRLLRDAGFQLEDLRYTIFFPGFLKSLIPYEKYLRRIPMGAHYYCIAK